MTTTLRGHVCVYPERPTARSFRDAECRVAFQCDDDDERTRWWLSRFHDLPSLSPFLTYTLGVTPSPHERGHCIVRRVHAVEAPEHVERAAILRYYPGAAVAHLPERITDVRDDDDDDDIIVAAWLRDAFPRVPHFHDALAYVSAATLHAHACCRALCHDPTELVRHRLCDHVELKRDERLWCSYAARLRDESRVFFDDLLGVPSAAHLPAPHLRVVIETRIAVMSRDAARVPLPLSVSLPSIEVIRVPTLRESFARAAQYVAVDSVFVCSSAEMRDEMIIRHGADDGHVVMANDVVWSPRRSKVRYAVFVDADRIAFGAVAAVLDTCAVTIVVICVEYAQPLLLPAWRGGGGWSLASQFRGHANRAVSSTTAWTPIIAAPHLPTPMLRAGTETRAATLPQLVRRIKAFTRGARSSLVLTNDAALALPLRIAHDDIKGTPALCNVAEGHLCVGDRVHELYSTRDGVVCSLQSAPDVPVHQGNGSKRLRATHTDIYMRDAAVVGVRFGAAVECLTFRHNYSPEHRLESNSIMWWAQYAGVSRDRVALVWRLSTVMERAALAFACACADGEFKVFILTDDNQE